MCCFSKLSVTFVVVFFESQNGILHRPGLLLLLGWESGTLLGLIWDISGSFFAETVSVLQATVYPPSFLKFLALLLLGMNFFIPPMCCFSKLSVTFVLVFLGITKCILHRPVMVLLLGW